VARRAQHVAEKLDAFAVALWCELRHAGDVPAGAVEARDEAGSDRITRYDNYGYLASGPLCRQATGRVKRHDDIDLISD